MQQDKDLLLYRPIITSILSLSQFRVQNHRDDTQLIMKSPLILMIPCTAVIVEALSFHRHAAKGTVLISLHAIQDSNISIDADSSGGGNIPEFLKDKIRARRPSLGHVVPKKPFKNRTESGGSKDPRIRPQGQTRDRALNNPSNLKILGGSARGKRLDSPEVYLRPMMGKVREAVFSTFYSFGLYDEDLSTTHLDIFSGSGSVGLESLSRGAQHCTFVDLSRNCCDTIERNVKWCEFDDEDGYSTRVVCADAIQALQNPVSVGIPEGMTFNIVTLCPPYEEIVYFDLIDAVANSPAVGDDTVILIEYPVELGCLPHVISRNDGGKLIGVRNRKYGRTVIAMYVVNPSGRLGDAAESRPQEFVSL